MTAQRIYRLPEGIATKAEFFGAVIDTFPLSPALSDERDDWEALADSLFQGLLDQGDTHVTILWPSPALPEDDFAFARSVLDDLVSELHGSQVVAVEIDE